MLLVPPVVLVLLLLVLAPVPSCTAGTSTTVASGALLPPMVELLPGVAVAFVALVAFVASASLGGCVRERGR
jgi:hypothetical protein